MLARTRCVTRARWAAWGLVVVGAMALTGCKKHKPPEMERVWLGVGHACSALKTGEIACWGANDAGQLGDRSTTPKSVPERIVLEPRPRELAFGSRHTCGSYEDGAVRCWGAGEAGQLGDDTRPAKSDPILVPGVRATAIAAGGDRTCVLLPSHEPKCWGADLGDVAPLASGDDGQDVTMLASSYGRTCVAGPRSGVRCTGEKASKLRGEPVVGIAVGGRHVCAVLENGDVKCWGDNDAGQLGDGTVAARANPGLVVGIAGAAQVAAGTSHTCARLRSGTVSCWGANGYHQLANGTTDPSNRAIPMFGVVGVRELSAAGDATCARLADGGVRCWGKNDFGQLGDGTAVDHDVPMPIRWR